MTQSGESKSKLAINEELQNKYEYKVLPSHIPPGFTEEYQEYLTNDRAQLRALTITDCSIISARLVQYSVYIQRCSNRDKSRVVYLKNQIDTCISSKVHQYTGQWAYQRMQAIQDNEYTKSANDDITQINQRIERLDLISLSIKNLADQYKNLQFTKIKEREAS